MGKVSKFSLFSAKNESPNPRTHALNSAATLARGSHLLVLSDGTEIFADSVIPLFEEFTKVKDFSKLGIAGGRLLAADHTLVSGGGIDFIYTKKAKYGYVL